MAHLTDGWPAVNGLPWAEIIRISYGYEIDVLIAAAVQWAVTPGLAHDAGVSFARASTAAAAHAVRAGLAPGETSPVGADLVLGLARALAEFDNWSGIRRPKGRARPVMAADPDPNPWVVADPRPQPWRQVVGVADAALAIAAANRLINTVGSAALRQDLSVALDAALGSLSDGR